MGDVRHVIWSSRVAKQLVKLPQRIQRKFQAWVKYVAEIGLHEARKGPGFHDEPPSGNRKGQRSIRLNQAYRAIYVELLNGKVEMIEVIEVNKHGY